MGRPRRFNSYDGAVNQFRKTAENFGLSRQNLSGISSALKGTPKSAPTGQGGINRDDTKLSLQFGGEIRQAIGFTASSNAISSGDLDITKKTDGSTQQTRGIIFVSPESGTSDTLDTITGKLYDGQVLILAGVSGNTITIAHNNGGAGGILCPDDTNYTLSDDECVILVDDVTAGTQTWRLISGGGGGGLTEPLLQTITTLTTATEPTTTDIDCSIGNVYKVTLDEDITFDFTNETASKYQLIHIIIIQDGTGGWSVTWPASLTATPTVASGASEQTDVILYTIDQGTTWNYVTGTSGASLAGANKQLSNLSSPVLNTNIDCDSNTFTNWIGWTADTGQSIDVGASGLTANLPSGDTYIFRVNGADQFEIAENSMDVHSHSFTNYVGYTALTGQTVVLDATGETHTLPSGDLYDFKVNGISEFSIGTGAIGMNSNLSMNSNKITSVTDPTSAQDAATKAYVDANGGDLWSDVVDADIIPDTDSLRNIGSNDGVTPKQFAALYTDVLRFDQSSVYVKKNTGTGDLELASGSSDQISFIVGSTTEWKVTASALDGGVNTLKCAAIEFNTSVNHNIQASAAGMQFNIPTSDTHNFLINSADELVISATDIDIQGNDLTLNTSQLFSTDTGGIRYKVPTGDVHDFQVNSNTSLSISSSQLTFGDGINMSLGTTTGTKIGTSSSQKIGFFNATPVVQRSAYTVTNHITDRSYDANSTTVAELADVLGTLIVDLRSLGLIAT